MSNWDWIEDHIWLYEFNDKEFDGVFAIWFGRNKVSPTSNYVPGSVGDCYVRIQDGSGWELDMSHEEMLCPMGIRHVKQEMRKADEKNKPTNGMQYIRGGRRMAFIPHTSEERLLNDQVVKD